MKYREAYFEAMYTLAEVYYPYLEEEEIHFKTGCYTKGFMKAVRKARRLLEKDDFRPPKAKGFVSIGK